MFQYNVIWHPCHTHSKTLGLGYHQVNIKDFLIILVMLHKIDFQRQNVTLYAYSFYNTIYSTLDYSLQNMSTKKNICDIS
jgi:hypothetical protein